MHSSEVFNMSTCLATNCSIIRVGDITPSTKVRRNQPELQPQNHNQRRNRNPHKAPLDTTKDPLFIIMGQSRKEPKNIQSLKESKSAKFPIESRAPD